MLDITNSFIKSGMGWGKKSERKEDRDRETEKSNKFSKKSSNNVTSPSPKSFKTQYLQIALQKVLV